MTTQVWTTTLSQQTDADFRAWGSELNAKLAAAGLVQTADTGQINWTTVVRPAGANTDAGYEMWRMNDTPQATAPVFFKIWYGNHGGATTPRIRIQVGTGSNGSGTLTGNVSGTLNTNNINNNALPTVANYTSYLCVANGFFGLAWKTGAGCQGGFFFTRSHTAGVPDANGGFAYWANGATPSHQTWKFSAPAVLYTQVQGQVQVPCIIPYDMASSAVGADIQVFPWVSAFPRAQVLHGLCSLIETELPKGTTFSANITGVSKTYVALESGVGVATPTNNANFAIGMLWE